eukprot:gnl/MRDRNA2_/MRDRNA2_67827_c0_seq1.p1 gnl/MRDRNA2_/MRDRNA2_67827_c0~~gnl/MRDRNA2_/MRDRNA2_67827_c0_seq1.p1  ORF type:complete len:629 (+),score=117.23 gnl/MRDRNA2_/MRDRNA2_67827_c0_seq1:71-1957(+)
MVFPVASVSTLSYPPGLSPVASRSSQAVTPVQVVTTPLLRSPKSNGATQNLLPIAVRSPTSKPGQLVLLPGASPKSGISSASTGFSTCCSPGSRANDSALLSCKSAASRFDQCIEPCMDMRSPSGKLAPNSLDAAIGQVASTASAATGSQLQCNNGGSNENVKSNGHGPLPSAAVRSTSASNDFSMPASISRKWQPEILKLEGDEDSTKPALVIAQASALSPHSKSPATSSQIRFLPQQVSPKSWRSPSAPAVQLRKPVEALTVLNPFAIRFSQPRINPYFMQGESFEAAIAACKEEPCQILGGSERSFIKAPFPDIEVVCWRPKLRNADGVAVKDAKGKQTWGEERWFTLDNRRLHCLQKAAIKAWPRACCIAVKVIDAVGNDRQELRKFRTTTEGATISIGRSKDAPEDVVTWDWQMELTKAAGADPKLSVFLDAIEAEEQRTEPLRAQLGASAVKQMGVFGKYNFVTPAPAQPVASQKIKVLSPTAVQTNPGGLNAAAVPWSPSGISKSLGVSMLPTMSLEQFWEPASAATECQWPDLWQSQFGPAPWDFQPSMGPIFAGEGNGRFHTGIAGTSPRKVKGVVVPPPMAVRSLPFNGNLGGNGAARVPCAVSGGGKGHSSMRVRPR